MWTPWLQQSSSPKILDTTLAKAVSAWREDPVTEKNYKRVLSRAGALDTKGLAHQISDMLVFDFLVGNWDRFSGVPEWYGANCQFADGQIVSIDNGAAFPSFANKKVSGRFDRVERFSRSFIHALRLLDKKGTRDRLFPGDSRKETGRFKRFWKQRAAVLGRVDELIERHGEDAVLFFD